MHSHSFVTAIKVDGNVLREDRGVVSVPFGSEYSIFLKNLGTVRALAKVSIDGEDATDDTWLIVNPNQSLDLERFIRNGNIDRGNRFKFIKRSAKVEEHRGIKAEDGLVRVEYKFEKVYEPPKVVEHHYHHHHDWDYYYPYYPYPYPYPYLPHYPYTTYYTTSGGQGEAWDNSVQGNACNSDNVSDASANHAFTHTSGSLHSKGAVAANFCSTSHAEGLLRQAEDPGITVPGSLSEQKFVDGEWFDTEAKSHVIVLRLVGAVRGKEVRRPITVKTKTKCPTCGTTNKSGVKFCKECGTGLELI